MKIPRLENQIARLEPLTMSNFKYLLPIAGEKEILKYSPSDISTFSKLRAYVTEALEEANQDKALPFIILDKRSGKVAGSTRFGHIDLKQRKLHIGWTWLGQEFRGTGLNKAVKELMINYAFGEMRMEKIEFRVDERNLRSRRALEKLGVKLEGILRKDIYLSDGYKRNTCCYGLLKEEWTIS
ncbi:GNAT family N-acetyltransferase [Robertkochia aurantiaca]|uniref:GNAT family N-acetyltransferase n=1 Tax=Robertkochia aurantiaca TaxID=2873700 RepID=UPI001CCB09C5|nr:GNAT family protein [Robertkochia sp. 3YJGBD-33]